MRGTIQTEADIRREAKKILEYYGYRVLVISDKKRNTNTPGTPDWFVGHPQYGNRWIGIDIKSTTGKATEEQRKLFDAGMIMILNAVGLIVRYVQTELRTSKNG